MHTQTMDPIGARVTGLSLTSLDAATVDELKTLLARHGVLVLPDQHIDDDTFLDVLQQLGKLTFTTGETPVEGYPDLNVISNVGRTTPPRSSFHTDSSYLGIPPVYTALRAVAIPSQGGETVFTNQYRAADTLDPEVRTDLAGRTIHHVVTGLDLGDDDETEADHPVLLTHPISGRASLYLTTPARCAAVSGMDQARAMTLIHDLYEHSTAVDNTVRHRWSPGDVVIWDNRVVLHRGDHADVIGDRVMHRGMVVDREA